jgi:hypothetical protein
MDIVVIPMITRRFGTFLRNSLNLQFYRRKVKGR